MKRQEILLPDLAAAVGAGHGDELGATVDAHRAVAELMLKGLAEAGVPQLDSTD